ncbi:MAG: ectoine/hydroxyectoine ABC transporter substrate-binding protein EhuB [Pseudomonadota bacterium]
MAAGAAACSEVPDGGTREAAREPASTLARARAAGTIRVGYANEAPYAFLDSASGRLTGEAPEIARVVLKDLGIDDVEGVLTEFGSLIPGLQAKRFDIIAAGMYILPKRCEQIAFSNPTYAVGEAFIVRTGNPLSLHGYEDAAKNPRARIGVVAGAVERSYAQAMGVPDERIVLFPTPAAALAGVEAGRVDAYAATSLTANDLLKKAWTGTVERAAPFRDPVIDGKPARGYGAFGFRREDTELKAAFDAALARFIGSAAHRELVRPFGFTERELPGEATAAALCRG